MTSISLQKVRYLLYLYKFKFSFINVLTELTFAFEIWCFPPSHWAGLSLAFLSFFDQQNNDMWNIYLGWRALLVLGTSVFLANIMSEGQIYNLGFTNSKKSSKSSQMELMFSPWLTPTHPIRGSLSVRSPRKSSWAPPPMPGLLLVF